MKTLIPNKNLLNKISSKRYLYTIITVLLLSVSIITIIKGVNAATTNQISDLNIIRAQEIVAKNAVVYDVTNKKFIYAKNADEPAPMASLVKIITAAVFLQLDNERSKQGNVLEKIQIIKKGNGYNQGDRELINGEFWKKENLIRYMLMTSSNIAAQSLTNSLVDDEFAFALLMNKMVRDLKYKSFSFKNSSGLPIPNPNYNPKEPDLLQKDIPSSIGNAKEIAVLFNYIFTKIPFLGEASIVSDATFVNWSGNTHIIKNVNDSLSKIPHVIAGKTGTTEGSGGNLVIIINPNQQKYVIVIMGSTIEDRYNDAIKLATATEVFSTLNNTASSTTTSTSSFSNPLSTEAFAPLK